jgi:hypothetical protein
MYVNDSVTIFGGAVNRNRIFSECFKMFMLQFFKTSKKNLLGLTVPLKTL